MTDVALSEYLALSTDPVQFWYNIAAAQRLVARILGAAVASGAALFGAKKLKEKREAAAVIALYQVLATHKDLSQLSAEEISSVGSKFGLNLAKSRIAEMKSAYSTFLESVIPVEEPLKYVSNSCSPAKVDVSPGKDKCNRNIDSDNISGLEKDC